MVLEPTNTDQKVPAGPMGIALTGPFQINDNPDVS